MKADYVHKDTLTATDYVELNKNNELLMSYNQTLLKENQSLKKQLENANEQINYLRRSIERKEETIIDLQDEKIPYTNEYVAKLLNQQKKFIEYLENMLDNENDIFSVVRVKDVLSKYKSIIGVSNENNMGK